MSVNNLYLNILFGMEIIHANRFDYSHDDPDCELPIFKVMDRHLNFTYNANKRREFKVYCPHCDSYFTTSIFKHLILGQGCPTCPPMYQNGRGWDIGSAARASMTVKFKEQASEVHRDAYDYTWAYVIKDNAKVLITCKTHGQFWQLAYAHVRGRGCPECGVMTSANKNRGNVEDFIKKARAVHGDRYDYSKVNYVGAKYKVAIICRTRGLFEQEAGSHTTGCGCPACGTYGFNQTIPGIFYNLKPRSDSDAYKIGITNRTVKLRYQSEVVMYDVLDEIHFECGAGALELETYLKRKYKQYLYVGSKIFNNTGMSELFSCDILQMERDDPQSPYASILTSAQKP